MVAHALTEIEGGLFVEGQALERALNQRHPDLLSALFERVQSLLFPAEWQSAATISPPTPDPVADSLLPDVFYCLFRGILKPRRGGWRIRGKVSRPVDPWKWSRRVEDLARILAENIEQNSSRIRGGPNPFDRPVPQPLPGSYPGFPGLAPPGSNRLLPSGGRRGLPFPGGRPRAGNETGPDRYGNFAAIDEYYTGAAKELPVRDTVEEGPKRIPEMYPAAYLHREKGDLRDLAFGRALLSRLRWDAHDDLEVIRRAMPYMIQAHPEEPVGQGVPSLMLITDSSGSMSFRPPPRPAGQYDIVLRACWGIFQYIQNRRLSDRVQVHAINFSAQTRSSGWYPAGNLDKVKRTLAGYQGQGTTLDVDVLRGAVNTAPGKFLAIIMTDGVLGNVAPALRAMEDLVHRGNRLVQFHIGPPNPFTQGIERLGCPVHLITKPEDLVGMCLDLARESYGMRKSA
jgi:hypothetical protein